MAIKEKLQALKDYYKINRKVGHSTLMKEGTNNFKDKKFILAYKKEYSDFYGCKPEDIISWCRLNSDSLKGHKRPLAIDNGIMFELLRETLEELEKLEKSNEKLQQITKIISE
jgi:AAA+ ATPase superfamily predicted ATPase